MELLGATVHIVVAVVGFSPDLSPEKRSRPRRITMVAAAIATARLLNVVGREVHFPPAEVRVPWEASAR